MLITLYFHRVQLFYFEWNESMLRELILENFVLMERTALELHPGLTVITGETGAGKSLLVKGLKLVLGARADSSLLRDESRPAVVQAVFDPPDRSGPGSILEDMGIELEDELVIRRVIRPDGRGRIYVNGALVNLSTLKQITSGLVGITSQHEYHGLMKKREHRRLLDAYGGLEPQVEQLGSLWRLVRQKERQLEELKARIAASGEERALLEEDAALIDRIEPRPGEEEELEGQKRLLRSSKELKELGHAIYMRLYGEKGAVQELMTQCRADMDRMSRLDPELEEMAERMESLRLEAEDLAYSVRDYLDSLPVDLDRLEQIEERLYQLRQLRRRFGPELEDVLSYRKEIAERLSEGSALEEELSMLEEELSGLEAELCERALALSRARTEAGRRVERAVVKELSSLNLEGTRFSVSISAPDHLTAREIGPEGADDVEFVFSANPDRPLAPLSAVASGGELSRVMLALQVVFARKAGLSTVVFDEVDTGIGGEVAEKVGKKMRRLSDSCQVLAITHFPQIAAAGQAHIVVEKEQVEGSSLTRIRQVEGQERVQELVRMLGGEREAVKAYAEELLGTLFRGA